LVKRGIVGAIAGIIVGISTPIACSDFYRTGPAYPTDQPVCYWLVVNGRWQETGIVLLILGILIGWLYGKIRKSNKLIQ